MIALANKTHQRRISHQHDRFLEMLPAITRHARRAFRHLPTEQREEAVTEIVASSFCAFCRLVQLGKHDRAHATVLAKFAVVHYHAGRRVGSKVNSSDFFSCVAPSRNDGRLESPLAGRRRSEDWLELVADNRCTAVVHQVSFRIDFPRWLARLSRRDRKLAKFLMLGHGTAAASRRFQISLGRVSQLRQELRDSWIAFHGALEPWEALAFDCQS